MGLAHTSDQGGGGGGNIIRIFYHIYIYISIEQENMMFIELFLLF